MYPNRKSFLMSFKNTTKLINSTFKGCGKIGEVLGEIFMLRINNEFEVDEWENVIARCQMDIFNRRINAQFK